MFWTPLSGSLEMTLVALSVGALSKPGVETGIGRQSMPCPSCERMSPVSTISWQGASSTSTGSTGWAIAASHLAWMADRSQSMPVAYTARLAASPPTITGMS